MRVHLALLHFDSLGTYLNDSGYAKIHIDLVASFSCGEIPTFDSPMLKNSIDEENNGITISNHLYAVIIIIFIYALKMDCIVFINI